MIVFAPFAATQLLPWPAIPSTRRGGPASRRIATGAGGFASCNRSHCRRPSSRTNPCEVGVRLDGAVLHGYAPLRCHWLELRPAGSSRARKLAPVGCFCGACQRHGVRKSRLARRQPPVRAGGRVRCAPRAFAGVHAGKFLRGLQRARVRWRREARELLLHGFHRTLAVRLAQADVPPGMVFAVIVVPANRQLSMLLAIQRFGEFGSDLLPRRIRALIFALIPRTSSRPLQIRSCNLAKRR